MRTHYAKEPWKNIQAIRHYRACKMAWNGQNGSKISRMTVFGHFVGSVVSDCLYIFAWFNLQIAPHISDFDLCDLDCSAKNGCLLFKHNWWYIKALWCDGILKIFVGTPEPIYNIPFCSSHVSKSLYPLEIGLQYWKYPETFYSSDFFPRKITPMETCFHCSDFSHNWFALKGLLMLT